MVYTNHSSYSCRRYPSKWLAAYLTPAIWCLKMTSICKNASAELLWELHTHPANVLLIGSNGQAPPPTLIDGGGGLSTLIFQVYTCFKRSLKTTVRRPQKSGSKILTFPGRACPQTSPPPTHTHTHTQITMVPISEAWVPSLLQGMILIIMVPE